MLPLWKNGHLRRDCWHWNKEQNKGKCEKNDNEKKCEHVGKDIEWCCDC